MDKHAPTQTAPAKPKRRNPPRKSVIEATVAAPMPVVEATPPAESAVEPRVDQAPASQPVAEAPVEPFVEAPPAVADTVEALPADPDPVPAAVAPTAVPPAAVPADSATEEKVMDTVETVDTASTKAQAMFADMNDRTKGAVEKSTKLVEEMAAFGKGNVEAMVESSRIAARGFESLGQDAAAFTKQQFEQSTAALKQLATVKSPTEFLKLHGDLVRQSFDQFVAQSSRSTESMLKLAGEIAQPLSNRFAVAAEKVKVQG